MREFIRRLRRLLTGQLTVMTVDTENPTDVEVAIARLRMYQRDKQPQKAKRRPTAARVKRKRRPARHEPVVEMVGSDGLWRTLRRSQSPLLFEALDYLYSHDGDAAAFLRVRAFDRPRSPAHFAHELWRVPQNRDAYRAFRRQEDAGVPF